MIVLCSLVLVQRIYLLWVIHPHILYLLIIVSLRNQVIYLVVSVCKNHVHLLFFDSFLALSLYDTCLPNLQDVMDNEFSSSTHYMPTPTTISSVSPFIQKSYDYSYSRPSFSSERITYSPVPESIY